jgi:uncharacterized protein YyaL (SSP411 family)
VFLIETANKKSNRLGREKSPYLLQHAFNPVDWYPWGEEAIQKASAENKPIFLSIGYSTCHWCHVMEHESFENVAIAEIMNKYFVCIKVDREERPDVDKVYMSAVQAMTGSGGWPLSIFLTTDLKPFYGGTYFPPRDAHGRPGFPTVLERIHEVWESEHEKIVESGDQLISLLRQERATADENAVVDDTLLRKTYHQLAAQYDPKYGGFGSGPKFPRPAVLNFLLRYFWHSKDEEALKMGLSTLQAMAHGGMYDHIGGGFHRYSVDAQWRVPHFEKMLYDQAQLVDSYLDAFQITHDETYARIARETLAYVLRDMTGEEGGFYSAEDADSPEPQTPAHTSEGAFYLWTKKEIENALSTGDAKVFCHHFGVDEFGNALSDPQGEFRGKNILFAPFTVAQTAAFFSMDEAAVQKIIEDGKKTLFGLRSARPRPLRDDKVIAAWNGLMISACARASRILHEERFAAAARNAAKFAAHVLYDPQTKTLRRRYRDGEAKFAAQLDDYAFLIKGLLDLYEATFEVEWLTLALELHGIQVSLFWDSSAGGFFDFSGRDKSILVRTKEAYDGAEPSGNSVAVLNLLRLSQITGDGLMKKSTEAAVKFFAASLQQSPHAMPQMMSAAILFLSTPRQIVISGPVPSVRVVEFVEEAAKHFLPNVVLLCADGGEGQSFLSEFLPAVASMAPKDGLVSVYVCENFTCELSVTEVAQLALLLNRA